MHFTAAAWFLDEDGLDTGVFCFRPVTPRRLPKDPCYRPTDNWLTSEIADSGLGLTTDFSGNRRQGVASALVVGSHGSCTRSQALTGGNKHPAWTYPHWRTPPGGLDRLPVRGLSLCCYWRCWRRASQALPDSDRHSSTDGPHARYTSGGWMNLRTLH